jgi:RNA polymerase sigma-70 factor (sigma-E family)
VPIDGSTLMGGGPAVDDGWPFVDDAPVDLGPIPLPATADAEATDLLACLFDAHYRSFCRLAYVLLGDPAQAEDVVQEAFLRTFTGLGRLRDRGRADAYLRRSVVNLSRSRLRRRSVEGRGNAAAHRADRLVSPFGCADLDLLEAVRALPPRQRAAVALFYYADLPESEVASTLGCSVGTVKSQLAKARATLARCLGEDPEGSRS